jgi:hypothetical protein
MWINLGILGLVGFIWILVWFFRVGLSHSTKKSEIRNLKSEIIPFLLSAMAVIITTGLVDTPYIKNDLAILFWLLPALLITTANESAA